MVDLFTVLLLAGILAVLIESRMTIGTKVAVMANDLDWIRGMLVKWGMVPPSISRTEHK